MVCYYVNGLYYNMLKVLDQNGRRLERKGRNGVSAHFGGD